MASVGRISELSCDADDETGKPVNSVLLGIEVGTVIQWKVKGITINPPHSYVINIAILNEIHATASNSEIIE